MFATGPHSHFAWHSPSWLTQFYSYMGAHTSALRYENERDRAWQRTAMPAVSVLWILTYHRLAKTPVNDLEWAWIWGAICYAIAGFTFFLFLKRRPRGGVHAQYLFMALDPMIVGWALYAAPEPLAWWLVLLLVMIVRVGFRYGLNSMKLELGFAWLAAMLPLLFSDYWHTQLQMTASLVLMLVCAWWLFAPLIRLVEKAKILEVENAKLQSLKDSLMAKSEFLSRVSHELRSPLQGVVSALNNLEKKIINDPDEAVQLSRIRRGSMTVNTQLRDLLTLARGDVGKIELNPMPFEAIDLAVSVAREAQNEADDRKLELRIEVPEDPIFVVADPGRVDQVLTNLLTNAIRHTKQGSVLLRLHPYDEAKGCLRFEIIDTGPGIDNESRRTLFHPYTRFGDLKSDSHGTGLGLAVVHTVVTLLGGKVDVTSEPGHGATFTVEIPAERVQDEGKSAAGEAPTRVLVVDDFQEALDGISSVVRSQMKLECDTASKVATAANLLGARRYDLVLLDLDLPIKSGYDVAAETRRGDGPNKLTRIVSISAADVPEAKRGAPFTSHLTKPITLQAIQRAIALPMQAAAEKK